MTFSETAIRLGRLHLGTDRNVPQTLRSSGLEEDLPPSGVGGRNLPLGNRQVGIIWILKKSVFSFKSLFHSNPNLPEVCCLVVPQIGDVFGRIACQAGYEYENSAMT